MRTMTCRMLAILAAGVGLLATGCRPAPRVVTLTELESADQRSELAPEYWAFEDVVRAPDLEDDPAVVAFTGFEVEFITAKKETPFKNQPLFGMVPISPLGVGLELSGLGRRSVRFTKELQNSLTILMRDKMLELYELKGIQVLGIDQVSQTEAFGRFQLGDLDSAGALQQLNFVTTDTGTVRASQIRPAPGHQLIEGTNDKSTLREVEAAILEELDADISVRIRLRVGVYRGVASLERGSTAHFVTRGGARGKLESRRSILGAQRVLASKDFVPVAGDIELIDPELYLMEMSEMMESYLAMLNWVVVQRRAEEAERAGN